MFSRKQLTWPWQLSRFTLKSENYPFGGILLIFHFTALSKTAGSMSLSIHSDFPKCLGLVHWLLIYVEIWWCALYCYGKPSVQNQHPLCITKSQYGLSVQLAEHGKMLIARLVLPLMNFGTFVLSPGLLLSGLPFRRLQTARLKTFFFFELQTIRKKSRLPIANQGHKCRCPW